MPMFLRSVVSRMCFPQRTKRQTGASSRFKITVRRYEMEDQ
jgi:hypothetical protein